MFEIPFTNQYRHNLYVCSLSGSRWLPCPCKLSNASLQHRPPAVPSLRAAEPPTVNPLDSGDYPLKHGVLLASGSLLQRALPTTLSTANSSLYITSKLSWTWNHFRCPRKESASDGRCRWIVERSCILSRRHLAAYFCLTWIGKPTVLRATSLRSCCITIVASQSVKHVGGCRVFGRQQVRERKQFSNI